MEFGIFIQNYVPNFRREGRHDAEHAVIMDDLRVVEAADRAGFKYVLIPEHHFLDEYSHLSANDVVTGYLAHATERIHIGLGHLQSAAPGQPPGQGGRAGGHARPSSRKGASSSAPDEVQAATRSSASSPA